MSKQLILGGARSGKSTYAEQHALTLAKQHQQHCLYVATAAPKDNDNEMQQRVKRHQQGRDKRWQLIEAPLDLAQVIRKYSSSDYCVLVDCLTLWLSNALLQQQWPQRKQDFIAALQQSHACIMMVSNEVGSGIVPLGELSRQFVDESGWLHQELASLCEHVTLVVAGLPMPLK